MHHLFTVGQNEPPRSHKASGKEKHVARKVFGTPFPKVCSHGVLWGKQKTEAFHRGNTLGGEGVTVSLLRNVWTPSKWEPHHIPQVVSRAEHSTWWCPEELAAGLLRAFNVVVGLGSHRRGQGSAALHTRRGQGSPFCKHFYRTWVLAIPAGKF